MGLILIYMAAERQQRAGEKRGGEFGTMREEGGQKMEGGIKLGKVCGLRQQQRHIPSWNAVIISFSLLPSFPLLFSSLCKFNSTSAKPFFKPQESKTRN